ncbi:MAG: dTDP-4-dehydrorhamnose 3,5-epimerase family protein [Verrucomicrobia bacterium]|nr:dTDP-4-dehydrorhamnose 3,5-epimerase family protein [Verrucomicrobiota bacterium]
MAFVDTAIAGVQLVTFNRIEDSRGVFFEAFRASWLGGNRRWVQWNFSRSAGGVVRGLHFHRRQSDYWLVTEGRLMAALVDVRKQSPTFRAALCVELDAAQPQALVIPPGVLHGYRALTDVTVQYLLDQEYDASDENGVKWDDPDLRLPEAWYRGPAPVLSGRDAKAPRLADVETC